MVEGTFRPTMADVAKRAELSVRSGFQHFDAVERLYAEALRCDVTRGRVVMNAIGSDGADALPESLWIRLLDSVVFGVATQGLAVAPVEGGACGSTA